MPDRAEAARQHRALPRCPVSNALFLGRGARSSARSSHTACLFLEGQPPAQLVLPDAVRYRSIQPRREAEQLHRNIVRPLWAESPMLRAAYFAPGMIIRI